MDRSNYTTVAALDLGNTNSGYAFSLKSEFKIDPLKIHVNRAWNAGGRQLLSLKTPTCVLLNKNKELKTFGYEAENEFADICMDGDQNDYYFFSGFYDKKNFTMDAMLIDTTGKNQPAHLIFTVFIKAFVNHLTECLDQTNTDFKKGEIRWVIPVSVSLKDTDKQFLRSCTEQAGINSHQLMLVTKAEVEFIYCQQLPDRDHYQQLKDGIEYMFVHLGGSSVDIAVLKKDGNQVVEKYRITGNEFCGTSLDDRFLSFFGEIFGSPFMKSVRQEDPYAILDIVRELSCTKRSVTGNSSGKIRITIPYVILDIYCKKYYCENLPETIARSPFAKAISMNGGKMRIDSNIIHSLFKASIDGIINLMVKVFTDYKDTPKVKGIVMVGGFSGCRLIQDGLKKIFSDKNIIIPEDPAVAVMKGAVLYGHQPYHYIQLTSTKMKAAQTSVTKCIFCDNPGIYHCTECTSAFCQQCRTKHDKLPTTKNHTVTDLKNMNLSAFLTEAKCVSHKSEFIYFCTKCHVLICGKCVTTEHKGHDITDIKTVSDNYRRSAEGNISDLKIAVTKLSKVVGQMKEIEKPTIKRTSESAVAEIGEAVKKIMKAVSFTKENKLDEVKSQLDMDMEEFQYDLKNKERIYEHQKNIYESLVRLMSVSHDITFITSYETLKRDIHDISDLVGEREQEQVFNFDQKVFVQETVNAIVANFEMSLVGKEDGSVVLMHKTDKKKRKRKKSKNKLFVNGNVW